MSVYLNNAATTWPKPGCVAAAMSEFLSFGGANLARGTFSERDRETLNSVLDCRLRLAAFSEVTITITRCTSRSVQI